MASLTIKELFELFPEQVAKIVEEQNKQGEFIRRQLESKGLRSELSKGASNRAAYEQALKGMTPEQALTYSASRQAKVDAAIRDFKIDEILKQQPSYSSQVARDLVEDFNRFGAGSPDPEAEILKEVEQAKKIARETQPPTQQKAPVVEPVEPTPPTQEPVRPTRPTTPPPPRPEMTQRAAPQTPPASEQIELDLSSSRTGGPSGQTAGATGAASAAATSRLLQLAQKYPNIANIVRAGGSLAKATIPPLTAANALLETVAAKSAFDKEKYLKSGMHLLGGGLPLLPHPAAKIAGVGIEALAHSDWFDEKMYGKEKTLDEEMEEILKKRQQTPLDAYKFTNLPKSTPTPSVAPSSTPSETPSASPTPEYQPLPEIEEDEDLEQRERPISHPAKPLPGMDVSKGTKRLSPEIGRSPASLEDRKLASVEEEAKKLKSWEQLSPNDIKNVIINRATKFGVPSDLGLSIFHQETAGTFNPNQPMSPDGAVGMSQITPDTYKDLVKTFPEQFKGIAFEDLAKPENFLNAIDAGLLTLKLKEKQNNLNINDPEQKVLIGRYYFGKGEQDSAGYKGEDYQDAIQHYIDKYNKYLSSPGAYDKESKYPKWPVFSEEPFLAGRNFREPLFKPKERAVEQQMETLAAEPVVEDEETKQQALSLLQELEGEIEEPKGKSILSSLDFLKTLQEESSKEKALKLKMMQNLLDTQATTGLLKGLALMASGVVGSGPKKKFATIPELKGMETFADIERVPASALAMQELASKDKYDDPTSAVSEAYRRYAGEILTKVDENFDVSKLEGLSANSIKTLLPMGIKEDNLLLKKLKEASGASKKDEKLDMQFANKIVTENKRLTGASGTMKDLLDQKNAADRMLNSTLGLPVDMTLKEFEKNKDYFIKRWNSGSVEKGAVDVKTSNDVVQGLNRVISGKGVPSQTIFKALSPSTWDATISKFKSYFTGRPQPASLGEYMSLFAEMTLRARSIVEQTRRQEMGKIVRPLGAVLEAKPQLALSKSYYDSMINEHQVDAPEDEKAIQSLMTHVDKNTGLPVFLNDYQSARKAYYEWKKKKQAEQEKAKSAV